MHDSDGGLERGFIGKAMFRRGLIGERGLKREGGQLMVLRYLIGTQVKHQFNFQKEADGKPFAPGTKSK